MFKIQVMGGNEITKKGVNIKKKNQGPPKMRFQPVKKKKKKFLGFVLWKVELKLITPSPYLSLSLYSSDKAISSPVFFSFPLFILAIISSTVLFFVSGRRTATNTRASTESTPKPQKT